MIPLGDLYRVIVIVYLLQLYQNYSRLLGYVDCGSPLGHLLGYLLKCFLEHSLKYLLKCFLEYPLKYYLVYFLKYLIKAQNCYLYNRA